MTAKTATNEWQTKTVQAWMLALLRFAVTLDNDDKLAVFTVAAEIDKLSSRQDGLCRFRFFYKTSADVCGAISNPQHAASAGILHRQLDRMTDDRLKKAFVAALGRDPIAAKPAIKSIKTKVREDLWKGLRC